VINFGVIGYGYWGPNIVRNLTNISNVKVKVICDLNSEFLDKAQQAYPYVKCTKDYNEIIKSKEIGAVAIITPVSTHFELAKKALLNDKHIFIEKPFTTTVKDAEELVKLADKKNLKIMVDHTFVFHGAVRKIKDLIENNDLGDLNYYDSTRVSLGLFQHDVNVIWDLAAHDFSIIDYIVKNKPVALTAQGVDHVGGGQENIAYITVYYENNLIVHINVNWLSPVKIRTTLIGGDKKMLIWDDLQADEKIKVYDKGVDINNKEGIYKLMVNYRSGDMWSPRVDHVEALKRELTYFVKCIEENETPINDGNSGLRVVKLLALADKSLKNGGKLVKINY